MTNSVLSIRNVTKRYSNHTAVNNVSLEVPEGSLYGMLGPNGAGKTSLIRMITTITAPDEGEIWLNGTKLHGRSPELIGYMPEERGLYKKMGVGEHLMYLARLKGLSVADATREIDYWLEKFEITDWYKKNVEDLSKGMQQKVQFIATVVHRPKLLILDEPFSGLDPINTNLIKDEIRNLNAQGTSIIFSTHRMEQVEEMCEYIVLFNNGQKILEGEVKGIKEEYKQNKFFVETADPIPESFATQFSVAEQKTNTAIVQLTDETTSNRVLDYLLQAEVRVLNFREILPTFNEIFIRRVQESNEPVSADNG